jgi:hypothetical protein
MERRAAALRHWERCFLDGTVDDEHGEFIAGILAAAGKKYRCLTKQSNISKHTLRTCSIGQLGTIYRLLTLLRAERLKWIALRS